MDFKGGEASNNILKSLHHEGVAIGNDKKMFFSDYGTNKEFLDVRFWDSSEKSFTLIILFKLLMNFKSGI